MNTSVPYRSLGRSEEKVSVIGIGGAHLGMADEKTAIAIVRTAIDNGITFMDNSWDYGEGRSEELMGKALRDGYRQKAFLMTKFDGHDRATAEKQVDESLRRLRTDYLDVLQLHEVIRPTDPEEVFEPGGSMELLLDLKKSGKVRYIGFTGHKSPDIHLAMLKTAVEHDVTFDTVQMPLSAIDYHYESFEKKALPACIDLGIGVLGMKSMAFGEIPRNGVLSAMECLRYTMSLPVSTVITGCESLERVEQALEAARTFQPLTDEEKDDILHRTRPYAGKLERFKTGDMFDATGRNPHYLKTGD